MVALLLVGVRLALPWALLEYVNRTLEELDGYTGRVEGIDLALLRGAYRIEGVEVRKEGHEVEHDFLSIDAMDLSVEWGALLHGSLVGEVSLLAPALNLRASISGEGGEEEQLGTEADWTEALDELMPISINRFEIRNGRIEFDPIDIGAPLDLSLSDLELRASNLSTVRDRSRERPARLQAFANVLETGRVEITGALDPLAASPDARVESHVSDVELVALNPLLQEVASIDAQSGSIELVVEIEVADGRFNGYVKPLLHDVELYALGEEEDGLLARAWEALVGAAAELIENQPEDQIASKIPLEGALDDPEADVWVTIWNLLRNAYVEAFKPVADGLETSDDRGSAPIVDLSA